MESRTKNTMRNMVVALLMQGVSILLSFVCRTIFATLLAKEYLGLSGLFTNIISVLALSELGIGSAIIVNLYKPLAENDKVRLCKLMNFYRTAYISIGLFVMACGVILSPFLKYLIKTDSSIPYLQLYFLLFVLQSASSYFFAYKQSILTAAQQEYMTSIVRQVFLVLMNVLQIAFLLITKSYIAYLLVSIFTNLGGNFVISVIADRRFPFLKEGRKERLTGGEKKDLLKSVSSMMLHKVGNTVINSTDNILISSMIGIIYTGLYSNYILIMNIITQVINIAFTSVSASIGDYNANKSKEECFDLFNAMRLFSYWIYGMGTICFCVLFQPTIKLWLGAEFLLDYKIVLIVSVNFFFNGIFRVPSTFSDVTGLYRKTKFKPISMALINLASSIVLAKQFGLIGIFIGTLISYLAFSIWVDPYFLYREFFGYPVRKYMASLFYNIGLVTLIGVITYFTVSLFDNYVLKVAVCGLLSNALLFLCYFRTKEMKFILMRLKNLLLRKKRT